MQLFGNAIGTNVRRSGFLSDVVVAVGFDAYRIDFHRRLHVREVVAAEIACERCSRSAKPCL